MTLSVPHNSDRFRSVLSRSVPWNSDHLQYLEDSKTTQEIKTAIGNTNHYLLHNALGSIFEFKKMRRLLELSTLRTQVIEYMKSVVKLLSNHPKTPQNS